MATVGVKSSYWKGVRDALAFTLVIIPFAMLFGVVSSDAGLNVFESLSFSAVVVAGAAQFTALQLMRDEAPTLVVLASALAVNLRMAMYSASLTPYLGQLPLWKRAIAAYLTVDQNYGLSVVEYERNKSLSLSERFAYFLGGATPLVPFWISFTLVGALVGSAIPMNTGLDFAMPIAFLAMIGPALNSGAHRTAALVASVASLLLVWMPWNFGLMVAAGLGMAAGAEIERRAEARA